MTEIKNDWIRYVDGIFYMNSNTRDCYAAMRDRDGNSILRPSRTFSVPLSLEEIAKIGRVAGINKYLLNGRGFVSFELTAVAKGDFVGGFQICIDDTLPDPETTPIYPDDLYRYIFAQVER